jgi:putative Mg2+ transporter-C (MgtC) family protein
MYQILHPSYWELAGRLFMAALLGGLIGWEREWHHHPAGFRTHILVSVGSALIMLISIYGFVEFIQVPHFTFDPSRISAQVVSGVGFLGAGAILRHGATVSGLTTAASLWVVAAVGLAVGAGYYFPALITTAIVFLGLVLRSQLDQLFGHKKSRAILEVWVSQEDGKLGELVTIIGGKSGIAIKKLRIEDDKREECKVTFTLKIEGEKCNPVLLEELRKVDGVSRVEQVY